MFYQIPTVTCFSKKCHRVGSWKLEVGTELFCAWRSWRARHHLERKLTRGKQDTEHTENRTQNTQNNNKHSHTAPASHATKEAPGASRSRFQQVWSRPPNTSNVGGRDLHVCARLPNLRGGLTVPAEAKNILARLQVLGHAEVIIHRDIVGPISCAVSLGGELWRVVRVPWLVARRLKCPTGDCRARHVRDPQHPPRASDWERPVGDVHGIELDHAAIRDHQLGVANERHRSLLEASLRQV